MNSATSIMKDRFAPVWARTENSGFALGSAGAFLVIESRRTPKGAVQSLMRG